MFFCVFGFSSPAIPFSQQLVSCVWGRLVVRDLATGTNIPNDIGTNKVHLQAQVKQEISYRNQLI